MFVFVCFVLLIQYAVASTTRPIIGILAQELLPGTEEDFKPAQFYIIGSYVKAVEAAGARVVPIFPKRNMGYYKKLMRSINAVLAPGGMAILQPGNDYYDALTIIYNIAKDMNDNGMYFPILGVCQGFEALLTISNNHTDIMTYCRVLHENHPLEFSPNYRKSLLYAELTPEIDIYLKYFDVNKHNHEWCTTPQNFSQSSLQNDWIITAENVNKRGLRFISSVEHKKYPFMATQFHADKYFEWVPFTNNPHSRIAIKANRYFYDVFVSHARLSSNKFKNPYIEFKSLIYNYPPVYSKRTVELGFEQLYVF